MLGHGKDGMRSGSMVRCQNMFRALPWARHWTHNWPCDEGLRKWGGLQENRKRSSAMMSGVSSSPPKNEDKEECHFWHMVPEINIAPILNWLRHYSWATKILCEKCPFDKTTLIWCVWMNNCSCKNRKIIYHGIYCLYKQKTCINCT